MSLRERFKEILSAFALLVLGHSHAMAQGPVTYGSDSIVVYGADAQPIRRVGNLPTMTGCSASSSGRLVVINSRNESVMVADPSGNSATITPTRKRVSRVSADDNGFVLVQEDGWVGNFSLEGATREWLPNKRARSAVRHPREGVVIVTYEGEVLHLTWKGDVIASFTTATSGREVSIREIAFDNAAQLIALDAKANEVVVLDPSLKEVRRFPAPFEISKVSFAQSAGSSIGVFDSGQKSIRLLKSDGSLSSYKTQALPVCVAPLQGGQFLVGYHPGDITYIPTGIYENVDERMPSFTYDSLAAVLLYAIVGSIFLIWIWRRVLTRFRRGAALAISVDEAGQEGDTPRRRGVRVTSLALFVGSLVGLYISYGVYPSFKYSGAWNVWGRYYFGAGVAAACLLLLAWCLGLFQGLRSSKAPTSALRGNSVSWTLLFLSLVSTAYLNYLNQNWIASKWILFTWVAAQILFVGAFWTSERKPIWPNGQKIQLVVLLIATVISRVYNWTDCPPDIHFDFGAFGEEAVKVLVEGWYPFFDLRAGQTIGRPWLLQTAAVLWAFGLEDWVIRIPSVIWSVGLVWASYLLGREVFSHRFGMIFGLLVGAQHTLLGYSRFPYVTESSAPFVFCLYYVVRGLKRHALRDWAIAGLWAAWSMMTVRQFTTFPFIGAAIFGYCVIVHSKTMWRHVVHVLVMAVAILITFAPYYNFYTLRQHLVYRLAGTSPLFKEGSITSDFNAWYAQLSLAFGGILRFPDQAAWPMETLAPTCLAVTGSLFGAGLLILLARPRSWATPFALLPMAVSITLGSAFLLHPPSYYHQFIGIIFVMFVVAVPLEGYLDAASRAPWRIVRWPLTAALLSVVGYCAVEQAKPLITFCSAPLNAQGIPAQRVNFYSLLSKFLIAHRHDQFISISFGDPNYSFHHANLNQYYGQFSERHDIRSPIQAYLPIRPMTRPKGLQFVMIHGYHDELQKVRQVYPVGTIQRFRYNYGLSELLIYSVTAADAQAAFEVAQRDGKGVDREFYALQPS